MKKFLAILLAMTLCMFSFAAIAEEAATEPAEGDAEDIAEIEIEPTFEGQEITLGETGLTLQIPADWTVGELVEGALCVYNAADGTIAMTVTTAAATMDSVWEQCAAVEGATTGEAYVNGNYYILFSTADGLTEAAYTAIDDSNLLAIAFAYANADVAKTTTASEIIGTLAGFEAEADTEAAAE